MLEYKGYSGQITTFDETQEIITGRVLGIQDVVTFEGKSSEELIQAFRESVDDYLEFCQELGKKPEKPYSGKVIVRMSSALHQQAEQPARQADLSLNSWIVAVIENYLQRNSLNGNGSPSPRKKPAKSSKKRSSR